MSGKRPLRGALQRLGVRRVEAVLVEFFRDRDHATTVEVLEATGLRQPEVSSGMSRMKARGWFRAEPVPPERKGRPMNRYHRLVPPATMRDHYHSLGKALIQAIKHAMEELEHALQGHDTGARSRPSDHEDGSGRAA